MRIESASQKLQRDGMEREARADEVISDWHNWRNCPEDCSGECEACEAYLCKLIETFAVRCANEARLEALEQAARLLDAEVVRHRGNTRAHEFCEDYGCSSLEEFAAAIRALKAEPVPPPKPAREGG